MQKLNSAFLQLLLICSFLFLIVSAFPDTAISQTFTRITDPTNPIITDIHTSNYTGSAWFDYDSDGLLDLVVAGFGTNFLYHNDGGGNFSVPAGNPISADVATYRGVSCADYDNDGDPDCFLAGQSQSSLYRNDSGTFVKISDVDLGTSDSRGWSPTWADYDNDGNLDLFITFPNGFVGTPNRSNRLLHSNGAPNFTFELIDTSACVSQLAPFTSANWSDYDHDGDMDLFVASGPASSITAPDYIYQNMLNENGVVGFEKITSGEFATDAADGQVFNMIDYDNDGDFDIHRTNWGQSAGTLSRRNDLYRNDNGTYVEILTGNIVTDQLISLAALWEDFDNDGDLDCYVANVGGLDNLYRNDGGDTFTSVPAGDITAIFLSHTGASAGDYDNDGDLDIFAVGTNTSRALYRNDISNGNGWIKLDLEGTFSNGDAIGARVRVKANINGNDVWQIREISAQNSFLGHSSLIVHFGLGDASQIDSLQILWPSGIVFDSSSISINQKISIIESCSDLDGDGISCFDNCPDMNNPSQVDADNDGIGDACDACPLNAENDADGDSFCEDVDNCPTRSNPDQADTNSDGIGDACCCQTRGDIDDDPLNEINISDLISLVDFMFSGGNTPPCPEEADVDGNGAQDIQDLVILVDYMFSLGTPPPPCL